MVTPLLIALGAGYLLGSLPFGYLVARAKGVNIFEVGSKNPGATNVGRSVGPWWGRLVLLLDALKGVVAVGWPAWFSHLDSLSGHWDERTLGWMALTGLVAALLGHSFSCFTGFRGGKGVATGAGGFAVLFPMGALVALVVWIVSVAITRFVSLASMLAAASLPVSGLIMRQSAVLVTIASAIALFVILRHRANISRLLAGTESKLGAKPSSPKS